MYIFHTTMLQNTSRCLVTASIWILCNILENIPHALDVHAQRVLKYNFFQKQYHHIPYLKSTKCRNMKLLKFLILAIFFNIICPFTTKTHWIYQSQYIPDIVLLTGYWYRNINKAKKRLKKQVCIALRQKIQVWSWFSTQ
jgi:hypothetical protein